MNRTTDFLFVSKGELSFLMSSLKGFLEDERFLTEKCSTDMKELGKIRDNLPELFILDARTLDENPEARVFLYDLCIEKNRKLVLIGEQEVLDKVMTITSESIIATVFKRPINNKEAAEKLKVIIQGIRDKNRQKKILVVDDSPTFLRLIAGWLGDDYCVEICPSATAAFRMIEKNKPNLILLDYEMPICNGAQFLEMLHSEEAFANIPVIFLTSRDDMATVREVLALHPQGYLLKTQTKDVILQSISDFFMRELAK